MIWPERIGPMERPIMFELMQYKALAEFCAYFGIQLTIMPLPIGNSPAPKN